MQTDTPITTIPAESSRAAEARRIYVEMGVDRSTAKVAHQLGKTKALMDRWCAKYRWVEAAQAWDDARAAESSARAAERYHADLEDHRERYGKAGRSLHALAPAYMNKLAQRIKDLDSDEIKPSRLALDVRTAAAALQIAGDLEAHALRLAEILPSLEAGHDRRE
jgi:hypothetical protein